MKHKALLLITALTATSALAQGTILYTWHGNSGYFQGSFQVLPEENQPGQYFEFGPFKSTFSVISPDEIYPAAGGSFTGEDASGYGPPLKLSVTMNDPTSDRGVDVFAYNGDCDISEYTLSTSVVLWRERGYWTYAAIPEPLLVSMLGLAAIVWRIRTSQKNRRGIRADWRSAQRLPQAFR